MDIPNAAIGLWAKCGAWCGRHLTDGVIPASQVKRFKGTKSQIDALLSARVWVESESESGAKLYRFHDWNEYQPTREEKLKEREDAAERQRKSRERKREEQAKRENVTRDSQNTVTRDSHECHTNLSQRPDPTRPAPTNIKNPPNPPKGNAAQPREPDHFATFWDAYAKKTDKPASIRAWDKAVKKNAPRDIITAAEKFIQRQKANGKHPQYTPNPATWLNREGWNDDLPPLESTSSALQSQPGRGYLPSDWLFDEPPIVDAEIEPPHRKELAPWETAN